MGETQKQSFQLPFISSHKVYFQGSRVTSDGGLIPVRELDERLGLEKLIEEHLSDSRQGLNKQFTLADLLRQSVYSRLAGYEDLNDAERLAAAPTCRLISSQRGVADATHGKTEPQASGLVQGLSLPSGQLEDGAASSGEGGVPLRGAVSASRVYRHEPAPAQPGGSAVL